MGFTANNNTMLIEELIEIAQRVGKLAYLVHQEGRQEYANKLTRAIERQLELKREIENELRKLTQK